jgi:hypothetical protein
MLYCGLFYGIFVATVYKSSASKILDDKTLTTAGMIGAACNGGSRIIWATLMDKYGFKKIYSVLLIM